MNLNWQKHGIDVSKVAGGKGFCPKCHLTRKHRRDKSLSVDLATGLFNCHHCDFRGSAVEFGPKKEYSRPPARLEKLSKKMIQWFEDERKISNNTLLRMGITEAKEWMPQFEQEAPVICFNYYRDDTLVNIKFRGPKKSFKMAKDAELIFYNLDGIKGETDCIIVEGEIDCLTLVECGTFNVVSVPNGASKGSMKLEYLDNCWQYFEGMTKIILATDGDEPGLMLRDELARRLGKEKCFVVEYPENTKDFNEILVKFGKEIVQKVISSASQWPVEGIKRASDMYFTTTTWYEEGYPKGAQTGIPGFDQLLTFAPGQLTTVTGIPGHGKDEFTNWIMALLAKKENWVWGICGFEETPEESLTKLIEKFIGKAFGVRRNPADRISRAEYETGIDFIEQHFLFVNTDEVETDIDTLLAKGEELVKRFGIKGFYLNPWNWIEHNRPSFQSETEYVSVALSKIIRFAKKFHVHVILLVHTTKMVKDKATGKYEVPTLYSIAGSANFFNKTHNGICVYRDYSLNIVDVYVQKVKQSWLGQIGFSSYEFDTMKRQYSLINCNVQNEKQPAEGNWRPVTDADLFTEAKVVNLPK